MTGYFLSDTAPNILFIDAYDSFSHNIIALVKDFTGANVVTIKIDEKRFAGRGVNKFLQFLQYFDAIIAGPGPGSPTSSDDVGLIETLWDLEDAMVLPILGICLGFQSLAQAYGARIERLHAPEHGIVTQVFHDGQSIFKGLGDIYATQYNSLHAIHNDNIQSDLVHGVFIESSSLKNCAPFLQRLAWSFGKSGNGPILMSIKHAKKPFWGIQYHPESICTNRDGAKVVQNWWLESCRWNLRQRQNVRKVPRLPSYVTVEKLPQLDSKHCSEALSRLNALESRLVSWASCRLGSTNVSEICETMQLQNGEVVLLESGTSDQGIPLNVETGRFSIIGCIIPRTTERWEYYLASRQLVKKRGMNIVSVEITSEPWSNFSEIIKSQRREGGPPNSPFWGGLVGFFSYEASLASLGVSQDHRINIYPDANFVLVQRSIVVDHLSKKAYVQTLCDDDTEWITQTKTIIENLPVTRQCGPTRTTMKHHLAPVTSNWPCQSDSLHAQTVHMPKDLTCDNVDQIFHISPGLSTYISKIQNCLSYIRNGDSYELCLTAQTKLLVPYSLTKTFHQPWLLYKRLRLQNPAPFSAFFRLTSSFLSNKNNGITILSSSPERFMCWSRPNRTNEETRRGSTVVEESTLVQFRPIKGTVSKSQAQCRESAETVLKSSKEMAENLMIVDLIRHDVSGVLTGPNDEVRVTKLMVVEEYATLWQLVSVIEGTIKTITPCVPIPKSRRSSRTNLANVPAHEINCNDHRILSQATSGVDVLAASLPPGSMTGAPKKRSCELLQMIEERKHRGIYSGVLGYMDVGGGGDFSVVIRTAWRWDDDVEPGPMLVHDMVKNESRGYHVWNIGAGGAITIQSEPEAEYREMEAKREALIGIFGDISEQSNNI